jgi:HPt (histidine-containing phosphotransfer) domain-containing protein
VDHHGKRSRSNNPKNQNFAERVRFMSAQPTLALEELLSRIGGDREFAFEMLNEWVDTLGKEISEIQKALEMNDTVSIRQRAHTLKGSAANLAAKEFARLAGLCEMAAIDANLDEIKTLLPQLSYEAETLQSIVPGLM